MRTAILTALSVAMLSAGIASAQAEDQPYYNPTNPASPTGFTAGYELYHTIGCPGKQLLDRPDKLCVPAPAPAPVAAPEPAPAPAPAPAPEPTLTKEHPLVLKDVNFDFNSAKLRKGAFPVLDKAAEDLKGANYPHVKIDGYTDSIGKDAYNMKLSERRAESVKKYLTGKGVPADSLSTKGYGETHFIASNKTKAGRAENRRVELHVE